MDKYCTSCGNKVYETFRVCPNCGNQKFGSDPVAHLQMAKDASTQTTVYGGALRVADTTSLTAAGNWARLFAYFVDLVCFWLIALLVAFLLGASIGLSVPNVDLNVVEVLGQFSGWVVLVLYFAIFHASKLQATPGKMAAGLRIVTQNGQRLGFGKAAGRALLSVGVFLLGVIALFVLSWVLTSGKSAPAPADWTLAFISAAVIWNAPYLMLFFNEERQTLFDRICGTRVVKR